MQLCTYRCDIIILCLSYARLFLIFFLENKQTKRRAFLAPPPSAQPPKWKCGVDLHGQSPNSASPPLPVHNPCFFLSSSFPSPIHRTISLSFFGAVLSDSRRQYQQKLRISATMLEGIYTYISFKCRPVVVECPSVSTLAHCISHLKRGKKII